MCAALFIWKKAKRGDIYSRVDHYQCRSHSSDYCKYCAKIFSLKSSHDVDKQEIMIENRIFTGYDHQPGLEL